MLTKTLTDDLDPNGKPIVNYAFDNEDGKWEGVLLTGPAKGTVTLKDGTKYDVTPEVIEHLPGHAGPISHHIEKLLEATGELGQLRSDPTHTCTADCGDERTD